MHHVFAGVDLLLDFDHLEMEMDFVRIAVTIEIKINFLSPADGEEIIARAETIQVGSSIAVVKIDVASQKAGAERACAFATATMRAVDIPAGFR